MERVTGWYKRRTQLIIFGIGLVLALVFNADTIRIANLLARDGAWRTAVASVAQKRLDAMAAKEATPPSHQPSESDSAQKREAAEKRAREAVQELASLGLPFGWSSHDPEVNGFTTGQLLSRPESGAVLAWILGWVLKAIGLLVTAFSVSLGAPFWFDLLNRISVVRSSLRPTERAAKTPLSPAEQRLRGAA